MNFEPAKTQHYEAKPIVGPEPGALSFILWALFGNEQDGLTGDPAWNPERADTWKVRVLWWMRNPFHNLTWHVIGLVHLDTIRCDEHMEDGPGMNRAYSMTSPGGTRYPFWRYIGDGWEGYFGWRARGSFGMKLVGKKPWALIACACAAALVAWHA